MAEILLTSVAENSASHVRQTEVQLDSFPNATPRRLPRYARARLQLELRAKQAETNKHNYDFFFFKFVLLFGHSILQSSRDFPKYAWVFHSVGASNELAGE